MEEKKRKILVYVGYTIFTIAAFIFFIYQTFPYDRATEYMLSQTARQLPGLEIKIGHTRPYLISGLSIEGITISTSGEKEKIKWVQIDRLKARLSLLSLIKGGMGATFLADLYGGTINGAFHRKQNGDLSTRTRIEGLSIKRYLPLKTKFEVHAEGKVSCEIDLEIPEGQFSKSDGAISLRIEDLSASNIQGFGFLLPAFITQGAEGAISVAKGKVTIDSFLIQGEDFDITTDGNIYLHDQLPMSSLKVNGHLKLKGAFEEQYEPLMTMFKKKDPDGFYNFSIMGILSKPRPYFK